MTAQHMASLAAEAASVAPTSAGRLNAALAPPKPLTQREQLTQQALRAALTSEQEGSRSEAASRGGSEAATRPPGPGQTAEKQPGVSTAAVPDSPVVREAAPRPVGGKLLAATAGGCVFLALALGQQALAKFGRGAGRGAGDEEEERRQRHPGLGADLSWEESRLGSAPQLRGGGLGALQQGEHMSVGDGHGLSRAPYGDAAQYAYGEEDGDEDGNGEWDAAGAHGGEAQAWHGEFPHQGEVDGHTRGGAAGWDERRPRAVNVHHGGVFGEDDIPISVRGFAAVFETV